MTIGEPADRLGGARLGDAAVDRSPEGGPLRARLAAIGAVLLVEYLVLSVRFEVGDAIRRGGAWRILGHVGMVPLVAMVVGTTTLLIQRPAATVPMRPPAPPRPILLAVHALSFAAFVVVTFHVFGRPDPPAGSALVWFALWGSLGVATVGALVAALINVPDRLRRVAPATILTGFVFGVLAWFGGTWTDTLWNRLALATLLTSAAELRLLFSHVVCDPARLVIGLDDFTAVVAPPCGGMEGIGLVTVLLAGYLAAWRHVLRIRRALLLIPIGIAAVWIGDTIRIAALVVVGARVDAQLALGAFHSRAGWVLFCVVALALAALARRSAFFAVSDVAASGSPPPAHAGTVETESETAPYLLPFLAMLATAMVTGMFAERSDPLYGLRVVAGMATLYLYRAHYRDAPREWSYASVAIGAVVGLAWLAAVHWSPAGAAAEASAPAGVAFVPWAAFRLLGAIAVVPVCEELAFRGYLLRRLVSADFTQVSPRAWTFFAIAGSSLAFGMVHGHWAAGVLAGAAYAVAQVRSGRIMDAIVAHAASNAVIAVSVVATSNWSQWS